MASPDTILLQDIGHDIVRTFAAVVVETFFLAIYVVLVFQASRMLIGKGFSRMPMTMLAVIITMFMLALVLWIIDIFNFVSEVKTTLMHDPDIPLDTKHANALASIFRLAAVVNLIYCYMSILGDAVIVWRVYALWGVGGRRWVLVAPFAMFFGSIGKPSFGIADCTHLRFSAASPLLTYCVVHLGTEIVDGSFQHPAFCKNIQTTTYCLAVATTAAATVAISVRTWEYRQAIKPFVNNSGRSRKVERVLMLLVESGVLYFLFYLGQVIGNIPGIEDNQTFSDAFLVYSFSTSVIVGMYPTAVVFLANSRSAVLEPLITTFGSSATSGAMFGTFRGLRTARQTENIEVSILSSTTRHKDATKPGNLTMES